MVQLPGFYQILENPLTKGLKRLHNLNDLVCFI